MGVNNIFKPAFGNRPSELIGREGVIADFKEGLGGMSGNRDRALLVVGQRGMGKTVLLLELADVAQSMDFVTASVLANEQMTSEIIQLIQIEGAKYFKKESRSPKAINAGALGFSFGLTFQDETEKNYGVRIKLSLLCDALAKKKKGILILIDEIRSTSQEIRELAGAYQHLVGEGKNIAIAMAGLPSAISDVLNDDVLTFFNRAKKATLEPLPLGSICVYFSSVFQNQGKEVSAGVLEKAVSATRGYPYLLQLIGYYLLNLTGNAKEITTDICDLAIRTAKQDLSDNVYRPALRPLSKKDIEFLSAMAYDEEVSLVSDIRSRMGMTPAMVQQYRSRLIASGIVTAVRHGELAYTLPYLKEYLRGEL